MQLLEKPAEAMGAIGVMVGILQYAGLYIQLNTALKDGYAEVDNRISGNALFTEVPHDITTHSGEDVEMACSFRGAGPSSYSLEIQWWYIKNHRTWREKPADITNSVLSLGEMSKDATKISVVKVAGSNISHKLRLSSVRASDEGTYECRVIDYSGPVAQHHRVWAYLQVEPGKPEEPDEVRLQQPGHRSQGSLSHSPQNREASQLRKATAGSTADCNESCEF